MFGKRPSASRLARPSQQREGGQALVIIAAAFIGIVAFVGLAIDLGILISQQAHLRRAVDSAAIAAATQVREARGFENIGEFTANFIRLNGLDTATLKVQRCMADDPATPVPENNNFIEEYSTETALTTFVDLYDTAHATDTDYDALRQICASPLPRKQIRVQAELMAQFAFMPLLGIPQTELKADAISEAASIDLVLVFGTSETMGQFTTPLDAATGLNTSYISQPNTFDPRPGGNPGCNNNAGPQAAKLPEDGNGKCRPLWDAKQAAKKLIDTLQSGYDRVAIVTYDFAAQVEITLTSQLGVRAGGSDSSGVYAAIDSIELRDSIAVPDNLGFGEYSPLNVNCRWNYDMDSLIDGGACTTPDPDFAVFKNCAGCGIRVAGSLLKKTGRPESLWLIVFLSDGFANMSDVPDVGAFASRAGTITASGIDPLYFPNGYCPGQVAEPRDNPDITSPDPFLPFVRNNSGIDDVSSRLWSRPVCVKGSDADLSGVITNTSWFVNQAELTQDVFTRYCGPYHLDQSRCAPGARYVGAVGYTSTVDATKPYAIPAYYDVYDYALDMVDVTALTVRCGTGVLECDGGVWPPNTHKYNRNEFDGTKAMPGAPITIYAIGLGGTVITPVNNAAGERLLRYMAAVGDDGDRATDPCATAARGVSCGNYYFAPEVSALDAVFQDIAQRIFTRLTR